MYVCATRRVPLRVCYMAPFWINYILNLYILSMCFVRYHNWIVCTMYYAALMMFFILKFI